MADWIALLPCPQSDDFREATKNPAYSLLMRKLLLLRGIVPVGIASGKNTGSTWQIHRSTAKSLDFNPYRASSTGGKYNDPF